MPKKCVCGQPAGGAYNVSPDPLAGNGGGAPGKGEGKMRGGESMGRGGEGKGGKGKVYPSNENPGYGLACDHPRRPFGGKVKVKLDAGMWRYHANRMDARRSQFDLGRVDAYI